MKDLKDLVKLVTYKSERRVNYDIDIMCRCLRDLFRENDSLMNKKKKQVTDKCNK